MESLVGGIPPVRSRRGPRRRRPAELHADKAYGHAHLRAFLRSRGITPRIARRRIDTSQRLGRHQFMG
jgi:IS5 family transposase